MRFWTLCAGIAVAASVSSHPVSVSAQSFWDGNTPVFGSDRDKRRLDLEERRRRRMARLSQGGPRPSIEPQTPKTVSVSPNEQAGTVIVDTHGRKLYYIIGDGKAYLYPISVGRRGFTWSGIKTVTAKRAWPSWTPTPEMRKRQSWLPRTMSGGIRNPLGAKAIYLGDSYYRIHGTNNPKSIGRAASSGCFRMMNKHVLHLAGLVDIGTTVHVVDRYDPEKPITTEQSAENDKPAEPDQTNTRQPG